MGSWAALWVLLQDQTPLVPRGDGMLLRASADHRQPSNLPHSWSGRNSDFHTWLWGPTPQWLPWLGEWGGRVSSMPLCPEEVIHEGISHSGSGGCRSGGSPVGSGTLRGKQLAQGPLCYPRDPAPTSSATCSSALAASSSCEGTGCFRASCGKAKGMWDQVEGAELHYSDLREGGPHHYLGGWKGGRCEGQIGLGGDGTSCKGSQWGLSDDAKAFWEYQVSLSPASPPEASSESLTVPDWASSMSKPSDVGGVGSGL